MKCNKCGRPNVEDGPCCNGKSIKDVEIDALGSMLLSVQQDCIKLQKQLDNPLTVCHKFKTEEEAKLFRDNAETAFALWKFNTGKLKVR